MIFGPPRPQPGAYLKNNSIKGSLYTMETGTNESISSNYTRKLPILWEQSRLIIADDLEL